MMFPGMMEPPMEPLLSENVRLCLRTIGFVVISCAIYFYGDMLDMPEAVKLV